MQQLANNFNYYAVDKEQRWNFMLFVTCFFKIINWKFIKSVSVEAFKVATEEGNSGLEVVPHSTAEAVQMGEEVAGALRTQEDPC